MSKGFHLQQARRIRDESCPFWGESVESFGDVWQALYPAYVTWVASAVEKGILLQDRLSEGGPKPLAFEIVYPSEENPQLLCLVKRQENGRNVFVSMVPLLQGITNPLIVDASLLWGSDEVNGEVSAHFGEETPQLNFFDPFFLRDREQFDTEKPLLFNLSAVALSLKPSEMKNIVVDHGEFYEIELNEFLKENPGKTKEDFPAPVIDTRGMVVASPTEYTSYIEYCVPVLEVKEYSFLDAQFYRLAIPLSVDDENRCIMTYLYASQEQCKDYVPKVGDDITGIAWLMGTLASEATMNDQLSFTTSYDDEE